MIADPGPERHIELSFAASVLSDFGMGTDAPNTQEGFTRTASACGLPIEWAAESGLMVATDLAIAHFATDVADLIHSGLLRDEARTGQTDQTDPVHLAANLLQAELEKDDDLADELAEAWSLEERARGLVVLAGLLAHSVAEAQHTTVPSVLAHLASTTRGPGR